MYGGLTMVTRDGKQLAREIKETCQIAKPEAKHKVSPLRKRMIRDMELARRVQKLIRA